VSAHPKPRWDQRRFISCSILFLGLMLPVTGVGNHLARHSSGPHADARWVVAHVVVGSLFVVFTTWHVALNRRALLRYLRGKLAAASARPSREVIAALAMVGMAMVLALT
jgi:hypothetical protein